MWASKDHALNLWAEPDILRQVNIGKHLSDFSYTNGNITNIHVDERKSTTNTAAMAKKKRKKNAAAATAKKREK